MPTIETCENGHDEALGRHSSGTCWGCRRAETARRWYADPGNRERHRVSTRENIHARRLAAFGLTREDYFALLQEQGGGCAICGEGPGGRFHLVVDHDHQTGEVRGLLCTACNVGIGNLRDDPELMRRALRYLGGEG